MSKILLVEDDKDLAEVILYTLQKNGYTVSLIHDGQEALSMLKVNSYDLIVLDWMLPRLSGIEIIKEYRNHGGFSPILMLTAKSQVNDLELGLDSGADDYITKPFEPKELLARIRALLRRPKIALAEELVFDDIVLNRTKGSVTKNGQELSLRPKLFLILEFFLTNPNQVFTPEAILERIWSDSAVVGLDTVRTHIKLLRKALFDGKQDKLKTIRGRGYRLEKKIT